jgi:AraC-like DNA-binding protein
MHYREIPPSPAAATVVASFWEFRVSSSIEAPLLHRIPIDGCVSLAVCKPAQGPERVVFVGPRCEALEVPVFAGDHFLGVRFLPGCSQAAIGVSGLDWRDQAGLFVHPLSTQLLESLKGVESLELAVPAFEKHLQSGLPCRYVGRAVSSIVARRGSVLISDIADSLHISERHLLRRFREDVGLSPKQFARICRARAAAVDALHGEQTWGEIAAERGYADQAHLSNEFSQLFGLTPSEFEVRVLSDIEHGTLQH